MSLGHNTRDALRILHDELAEVIRSHEAQAKLAAKENRPWFQFLHHYNKESPIHWTSILVLVVISTLLTIAYGCQKYHDHWLVLEVLLITFMMVVNTVFVRWDLIQRETEMLNKAKKIVAHIKECSVGAGWTYGDYINQHAPQSQCISVQWTYRDNIVVNLPVTLLVEGDLILLRPGQKVPVKCRKYYLDDGEEIEKYEADDEYRPEAEEIEADSGFVNPQVRAPFQPQPFMILHTPFIDKLRMVLAEAGRRPTSVLNNERYKVYTVWVERRMLPTLVLLMLGLGLIRYIILENDVGHWTEVFIVLMVHAALPLTTVATPVMWKLLDLFGVAKILVVFRRYRQNDVSGFTSGSVSSDSLLDVWDSTVSWKEALEEFQKILKGYPDPLPRTANIIHALGNVTSLCCVDKKGVLSWPNPTAEKVFFITKDIASTKKNCRPSEGVDSIPEVDEDPDSKKSPTIKLTKQEHEDYVQETSFEVLDMTQDAKNGYSLQFDDPEWSKHLPSLKPLGLNILLNTCNKENLEKYSEFADHVICASLSREESVPVMNRRCFCELARQIGFTEQALSIFESQQILCVYRHLAPLPALKKLKLGIKYKMPMPNMFSVIAKDNQSGLHQMMSQGTADILLDACAEYWNGTDICPLTDLERKKISDFYHRTSMSSYCTAFSYRPLSQAIHNQLSNTILEIPENRDELYHSIHSPTPSRSWDMQSLDSRLQHRSGLHSSVDSLRAGTSSDTIHDADSYFQAECNQIFIGMISMQYQAKQDIVQLIEDLEAACIRFVHFSKENELRSRVFSEKMGLEAGWNCHISLLSDSSGNKVQSLSASGIYDTHYTKNRRHSLQTALRVLKRHTDTPPANRNRRRSAPCALSLDVSQVKFENNKSTEGSNVSSFGVVTSEKTNGESAKQYYSYHDNSFDEASELLRNQDPNSPISANDVLHKVSSQELPISSLEKNSEYTTQKDPLIDKKDSVVKYHTSDSGVHVEAIGRASRENTDEDEYDKDEDVSSESYPASSHYTENTDSVTGGFGLTNRAKLPKGIENIRPHIDNVDNVPLLVSLFTDCTPNTTKEMLGILQEYGEVVCCFGSSASIENCDIFLQADCGLAVEPHYPQVCVKQGVVEKSKKEELSNPMELGAALNSIACSFTFDREDRISIVHLIAQAREHCQAVRNAFLLLLMFQLTLCLLQLLDAILLLPPILSTHHVVWLVLITLPLMTVSMMGSAHDNSIMKKALGKNKKHLTKQAMIEFVVYYMVSFVPTLAVCLLCHSFTLSSYCESVASQYNSTCHILLGHRDFGEAGTWNGWKTAYSSALTFSQNFAACQLVIYFGCTSLCYIHRLDHLWKRSPLLNRLWCIITPVLLILQFLYCVIDVSIHNQSGNLVFHVTDTPVICWVLAFVWPFVLIPILELIKRREIRLAVRYQKRARLDFHTKLGMNSPF